MSLMLPGHIVTAALNAASDVSAIKYLKLREGLYMRELTFNELTYIFPRLQHIRELTVSLTR